MRVELDGVAFRYSDDSVDVVDSLDLSIGSGECIALTGASGSGKTTVLGLIGIQMAPTRGHIRVDGRDAWRGGESRETRREASRATGWLMQTTNILARRTVLDNAILPLLSTGWTPRAAKRRALEYLARVEIEPYAGRQASTLSGGERQRLCLARALVTTPQLVLADEPTGQLDAASTRLVGRLLTTSASLGNAVVVATHDASIAAMCDRSVDLSGLPLSAT